ncbi:hypothetical protein BDF14DRAFT_264346 [Spinellus fusiger]|nr:hypothetical protein BDF14DRAFT_264346 [Spinellus fusiger]
MAMAAMHLTVINLTHLLLLSMPMDNLLCLLHHLIWGLLHHAWEWIHLEVHVIPTSRRRQDKDLRYLPLRLLPRLLQQPPPQPLQQHWQQCLWEVLVCLPGYRVYFTLNSQR